MSGHWRLVKIIRRPMKIASTTTANCCPATPVSAAVNKPAATLPAGPSAVRAWPLRSVPRAKPMADRMAQIRLNPPAKDVDVSVCIANWNCLDYLRGCLQSLCRRPGKRTLR